MIKRTQPILASRNNSGTQQTCCAATSMPPNTKNVVLGLIFLKYLSDRFDERYQELVAEGYGDEEDRDCYMEQNVFFVPEEARWTNIAQAAHTPEIGQIIDNAMRAIEHENDKLKDVLPKNFARPELDKRRLGDVVDLFK